MTKKLLFFLFALLCSNTFIHAQVVVSTESFDAITFPPTGWAIKPLSNPNLWVRSTAGNAPTCMPNSGAGMARFRSRTVISGVKQQLATKNLDFSNRGTSAANVSFWMYRDDSLPSIDSITVYANATDSVDANAIRLGVVTRNRMVAIPDTQAANGWYQYTFAIPTSYTGNTTTHIIFEGTSDNNVGAGQGVNEFIDDVSLDEYPMPCTGTPNVGSVTSGQTVICNGTGSTNLSLTTPITNTAGLTYTWLQSSTLAGPYTTFGTNAATANTGVITSKMYYKCYTTCAGSGLSYATPVDSIDVIVAASPTISISPNPAAICAGSTTGVVLHASGAVTYVWSPAATLSATTGDSVTATPTVTTQYVVIGTDSNGCKATANRNVNISNPPNGHIVGNPSDTMCIGGRIIMNYQGGPQNGNTYIWSNGVTTRRDTIYVTGNTTYKVKVTNTAGCFSYDSVKITALPAQNSGFKFTDTGFTYTFTDTTTNSSNWQWYFGDGNSSTSQNPVYTFSAPGTYQVTLIVTGPCKTDTITKTINIYAAGITNIALNTHTLCYPNPTNDNLFFTSDLPINEVKITTLQGQMVQDLKITPTNKTSVAVSNLAKGMYTLQLISGTQIIPLKFVKE